MAAVVMVARTAAGGTEAAGVCLIRKYCGTGTGGSGSGGGGESGGSGSEGGRTQAVRAETVQAAPDHDWRRLGGGGVNPNFKEF